MWRSFSFVTLRLLEQSLNLYVTPRKHKMVLTIATRTCPESTAISSPCPHKPLHQCSSTLLHEFLRHTGIMLCLITLPYEVLSNIVNYISFDDVFHLGRTCKVLQYLLEEESICKFIVQTKINYSNEAITANLLGHYSSALRRVAKRREAFAAVSPFSVAIVGVGDAYIYYNGVLCYTIGDRVRVLDLHNSSHREIVVSVPDLLIHALSQIENNTTGNFRILYYADNIISCIYKSTGLDETAYLIAFDIRKISILAVKDLNSTEKIFARHNRRFLYFGTHSEVGSDGFKKWVIHGYDFERRKWFDQKVHLLDLVGSELGRTVCFEFHDNYFYALSNQTSFEVEEIDWTSFYNCLRFPLESPCKDLLEKTENKTMWRRQHQEGPIDDRWTRLRLDADEATGKLNIIESRKEWHQGSSRIQRTHYTTEIKFPKRYYNNDVDFLYSLDESSSSTAATSVFSQAPESFSSASSDSHSSSSNSYSSSSSTTISGHDISELPDENLVRLLTKDDNPHHIIPPPRLPQNTHPGDDGSRLPILARTPVQYYHTSANTFFDLVDDPLSTDWQGKQRLRLRAGSRKLGPVLRDPAPNPEHGLIRPASNDLTIALEELYRETPITYWPRDSDPQDLYTLLNPLLGNVHGTADERSLVYVTGGCHAPQAIVFVSFDPAIRLGGLKAWGGMATKGVGEGPHVDGRATGPQSSDVECLNRTVNIEEQQNRKGKGKAQCSKAGADEQQNPVNVEGYVEDSPEGCERSWAWKEIAMYQSIGQAYWFGL